MDEDILPSRLDMDAEIHQAISLAHRINEKMTTTPPEAVQEVEEEVEPPPPPASKKQLYIQILIIAMVAFFMNWMTLMALYNLRENGVLIRSVVLTFVCLFVSRFSVLMV